MDRLRMEAKYASLKFILKYTPGVLKPIQLAKHLMRLYNIPNLTASQKLYDDILLSVIKSDFIDPSVMKDRTAKALVLYVIDLEDFIDMYSIEDMDNSIEILSNVFTKEDLDRINEELDTITPIDLKMIYSTLLRSAIYLEQSSEYFKLFDFYGLLTAATMDAGNRHVVPKASIHKLFKLVAKGALLAYMNTNTAKDYLLGKMDNRLYLAKLMVIEAPGVSDVDMIIGTLAGIHILNAEPVRVSINGDLPGLLDSTPKGTQVVNQVYRFLCEPARRFSTREMAKIVGDVELLCTDNKARYLRALGEITGEYSNNFCAYIVAIIHNIETTGKDSDFMTFADIQYALRRPINTEKELLGVDVLYAILHVVTNAILDKYEDESRPQSFLT